MGLRAWTKGTATEFSVRFDTDLEFWDFVRIFARVMLEGEALREDLMLRVNQVLETVPAHRPMAGMRNWCTDHAHASAPAPAPAPAPSPSPAPAPAPAL